MKINYDYLAVRRRGKWIYKQSYRKEHSSAWVVTISLLAGIFLLGFASLAHAETASYYDYQSCIKEGSSGKFTASGEKFNHNDLTAAMWGVKFGTLVKVTNLDNGKSVIVRVNDRGPSKKLVKKGRIIDLSKGAFSKIASLKRGVVRVKVEVL
jgi:rare lipoprotein A